MLDMKLFMKAQNGDELALKEFAMQNIYLVKDLVKEKYSNSGFDLEELEQVGVIGLIEGIKKFDINGEKNFESTIRVNIVNIINSFIRSELRSRNNVSIHSLSLVDDFDMEYDLEEKLLYEDVCKKVSDLEVVDELVISMIYGFNNHDRNSQRKVSRILGLTQKNVSDIKKKNLQRIKNQLINEGYLR